MYFCLKFPIIVKTMYTYLFQCRLFKSEKLDADYIYRF